MAISFYVNEKLIKSNANPLTRLIDVLRQELSLTGTKEGCSEGECGACAVLLNDKVVNSCLIPISTLDAGDYIITVEHYTETNHGKALVNAFLEEGAVQCGYCIPGMIMSAHELLSLANKKEVTELDVRRGISGNLCRCTGYDHIVNAILKASKENKDLW